MRSKHLILSILSVVTLVGILSTGCKKSNNSNSGGVSATVGSTNFSATVTTAVYSRDSAIYAIYGTTITTTDTSVLYLIVAPPFTVNTATNSFAVEYYHAGKTYFNSNTYGQGSGSLTVTGLDTVNHKISGNFNATMYNFSNNNDSVMITKGQFNTSYQSVQ